VVAKFDDLAAAGINQGKRGEIVERVADLENLENVQGLMAMLRP